MATVSRHGKGWRAQIRRKGHPPVSKTFPKKSAAWAWAHVTEPALLAGALNPSKHTVREALEKYRDEVSPKKGGARWERLRLAAFARHPIADRAIGTITADHLGAWRDDRLGMAGKVTGTYARPVKGSTVRRELNLWDSVLEVARKEWKWIQVNPARDVEKPPNPRSRQKGIPAAVIKPMERHLAGPMGREVFLGWVLGMDSAMRAGEMWGLDRTQIDMRSYVAHLSKTKNGDERDVPLFPLARKCIRELLADGRDKLFTVDLATRDALFRKARKAAGLKGFTFHDSRSEGISRLSKRMDVLELARVVGHRDINSLLIYYRADAAAIARRRASPRSTPTPRRQTSGGAHRGRSGARGGGTRGR